MMLSSKKVKPIFVIPNNLRHTAKHYKSNEFNFNKNYNNNSNTSTSNLILGKSLPKTSKKSVTTLKWLREWFMQNLRNYCNTTSLHGFNYITRSDMTKKERYFWLFVVIISIIISIALVVMSYTWNRETPTVTVIESSHHPTWDIPFPAITLCNFNKISRRKALDLLKVLQRPPNSTDDEILRTFHILMYYNFALNYTNIDFNLAEKVLKLNNMTLSDLSERLTPNCLKMISKCIWKGISMRCDSLFQNIYTIEGPCCSFNYFALTNNSFEKKIAYQIPKKPNRITGCGYSTGLSVLLNPLAHDYFSTYFSSYGFRFMLHDAYDFPDENAETKVITSTRESFVRIIPESTYATKDVKNMNIGLRNCLFPKERKLLLMQRYSFENCMVECRMSTAIKKCGCAPDKLFSNGSFPLCDVKDLNCLIESREIFVRVDKSNCNCLPDCEAYNYYSEITSGKINDDLYFQQENDVDIPIDKNNIMLHVFYSDLMTSRYRREIYQNWLSALASFGGLLGLIMGFSIVTAFEFIYFLTFRPIFSYFSNSL